MKFKGEAENSWTEEESRRDDNGETHNYTVKYEADEEYFENKNTLVGGGGEKKFRTYIYPKSSLSNILIFVVLKYLFV